MLSSRGMDSVVSGRFISTRFTPRHFMSVRFTLTRCTRCQAAAAAGRSSRSGFPWEGKVARRLRCRFGKGSREGDPSTCVEAGYETAAFTGSGRDSLPNSHGSATSATTRRFAWRSYSSGSVVSGSSENGSKRTRGSSFTHMSPSEAEWRLMLTEIGVQPRKMSRILTQYHAMPADVAMERLIFLQSLGVDTGKALSSFPKLLFYPPSIARAMADYLTSIGVQPGLIGKVLSACPQLLGLSIENNICPTISHLVEAWGLDQSRDIPVVISRHPRCLTYSISENLQPTLAFWLGSGITKPAKLIRANPSILGLSITKRILPTIAAFDSYGIPPHHTINMLQRFPHLFNYSWNDNLMPKLQYLEEVGRGIDEAVQYPQYFGYSLVRRIRPRLGGVARAGLHVSLSFVLRLKDEDFERLYGDVCAEEGGGRGDTREGHEQESCLREAS